jgi:tetratricopeptide (TPR) repeat protein
MFGGSLTDAEWYFGEAHGLFTQLNDERGLAYIEQHRAWIAFLSGDLAAAREKLTRAAETHERLGDRNGVGWAFGLLAFVEFFEGRFQQAEELAAIVGTEAEQRGDMWAAGMMDTLLADLRLWQGKLEDAATFADKARQRFKRLNDKFGLSQAMAPLVRAQIALGRHAAAQRTSEELLSLAESSQSGSFALMAVAGAAMHRGNGAVAAATAERALAEIAAIGGEAYEPTVVLALAYAQLGRVEDAMTAIESVPPYGHAHPFTRAVAALVNTVAGLPAEAIEHADAVATATGATYLDNVFAYLAAAGAYQQLGDLAQATLAAEAAVAGAMAVGDVVATALATTAYQLISGNSHPAFDQRTPLGDGWTTLLALLTGEQKAVVGSAGD